MDINSLLKKMTLREKVLQLEQLFSSFFLEGSLVSDTGPVTKMKLQNGDLKNIGTILNSAGAERMKEIQSEYIKNNPHNIPTLFMLDVIHGYRTIYPVNLGLAASFDMDLVKDCASMAAKEASVDGVQVTFAPMVDIGRDARWGRVAEGAGEDTYLSSEVAKASVQGFQGDNLGEYKIASCVKHFAAYGAAEAGLDYNTVDMSERTLREYYLPMYKAAIDAGAELVMASFNVFDGIPVIANKKLLTDILRNEWGFDGVVISDYGAVMELLVHGIAENETKAAALSFNAGCDIEMMTTAYAQSLETLINEGVISESLLDTAVLRVLRLKDKLGLFENPFHYANPELAKDILLCKEHRELAKKAACESMVLLKNQGVLPFNKNLNSIAVIGPLANTGRILGIWKCRGEEEETVTVFEGVKNLLGEDRVYTHSGCSISYLSNDITDIPAAKELAAKCDAVILCLGEDQDDSGESSSKVYLDLPEVQYKLFSEVMSVNKNTAVLLFTARPLTVKRLKEEAPALLNVWFPGSEGGNAIAEILFGDQSPCGKLPITFPQSVGQCPIYYNHYRTGRPRTIEYPERAWCQSAYIDSPNEPLYPFGYGLSYTNFVYGDVYADKNVLHQGTSENITVSCTVTNVGKIDAKEITQLYIQDMCGSVVRPVKELKGFCKNFIKAGDKITVSFSIDEKMLEFYRGDLKKVAEKGVFKIYIGANSDTQSYVEITLL